MSKYSSAPKPKKRAEAADAAAAVALSRDLGAQVGALEARLAETEERSAEYRRQAGSLRDKAREAESLAARLAGELQASKSAFGVLESAHKQSLQRGVALEEQRKAAEQERDVLRERGRVATVVAAGEQARLQSQLAEAVAGVEKLGAELREQEQRAALLSEKLDASRRECEGLRGRVVDAGELDKLKHDHGAATRLASVKQELERSREAEQKESRAKDEWRHKFEEAEKQLRLEKAARSDESRLGREKLAQQERATARVEEALKSAAERAEQLSKQAGEERTGRRAAEDEKVKLQARVRALEASAKQSEAGRVRSASLLNAAVGSPGRGGGGGGGGGGAGDDATLMKLDLSHAQRRAEEAEKHEKRALEEAKGDRERREQAEAATAAALRKLKLAQEESERERVQLQREVQQARDEAAELRSRAARLEDEVARARQRAQQLEQQASEAASRAGSRGPSESGGAAEEQCERLRQQLQLETMAREHTERKATEAERRHGEECDRLRQEAQREQRRAETLQSELRTWQQQQQQLSARGAATPSLGDSERRVTLLQEQLNEALRDAAQAKLALRLRSPTATSPFTSPRVSPAPSPSRSHVLSPKRQAALPSPRELQGTPRDAYKQHIRAGKAAQEQGNAASAVAHFKAAALLAADPKLDKRIAKLESQL